MSHHSRHSPGAHTLKVPGATIHYEVRGSGPVLLMIPGGPQDAGVYTALAEQLADRYTTVAYDPRGNSRSKLDGEPEDQRVEVHSDDAARLVAEVGGGPAYVFGNSAGAQIGLDMAVRHPEAVRALLAHEPPCLMLLDDPSEVLARDREVYDTYRREGVEAAIGKFMALNGLDEEDGEAREEDGPEPEGAATEGPMHEDPETFERVSGNFGYFLAHGLMPLSLYRPDVEALREGGVPVTVGLGDASAGKPIHDIGLALVRLLGTEPVAFPGDHTGFGTHPRAFAEALHGALDGAPERR
ncbi:alpha/beta fold hydrolase [Nocardiopsis dassonvillei]|jgi:pimeloyl-ACP methyl ester carboxylesterase|uniref:alpha/beta fold hydrolase n=1 Tax=Nocardiopsis dassonvillei TaxID=2014 RepID=UPI000B9D6667|nr:alpha/beta hydrolase [Nocardiopsis dassonvillei]ASU57875.1 alpha/beta hydrolase [Nocardiopsis dassonvillei]